MLLGSFSFTETYTLLVLILCVCVNKKRCGKGIGELGLLQALIAMINSNHSKLLIKLDNWHPCKNIL